jgi:hypothetical protein
VQIRIYGVGSLWYGALATAAATFVGHYPVGHSNLWPFLWPHSERKLLVVRDLQLSRRCEFTRFLFYVVPFGLGFGSRIHKLLFFVGCFLLQPEILSMILIPQPMFLF